MIEKLITRAEVAEQLHCSERTVRRIVTRIPGFWPIVRGRKMLFTPADVDQIVEALRRPPNPVIDQPLTRTVVRYGRPRGEPDLTAQERVRELTRKLLKSGHGDRVLTAQERAAELTRLTTLERVLALTEKPPRVGSAARSAKKVDTSDASSPEPQPLRQAPRGRTRRPKIV